MKKIRILVISLLLFLFCGCSGNYNLTINDDLTFNEELDIYIESDNNNYEKTISLLEKAEIDSNKYEVYVDDGKVYINYKEEYDTLEDYLLNSKLYHVLFDTVDYSKDNVGMTINTENNFKLDDKGSNEVVNSYDIDNLKINIKMPFYMNKSNEDSKQNDIYTWEINKNDTKKEINMDFSYKKASTLSIVLIVLLAIVAITFVALIIRNLIKSNKI